MPQIVRLGDKCGGHGGFPPRPSISASPNVFANGVPVVRKSDSWASHCDPDTCHTGTSVTFSGTVFANGLNVCRIGDSVDCGSTMVEGSPNVFAG